MNPRVAAAGAAAAILIVVAALSSAHTDRESAPVRTADMPSYCGTKAAERLAECGWTETTQKAPVKKPYDSCAGATEDEVRKMWVVVKGTQPPGTDSTRVTAELLEQAANLCREFRDAKPTPLPDELKKLVR